MRNSNAFIHHLLLLCTYEYKFERPRVTIWLFNLRINELLPVCIHACETRTPCHLFRSAPINNLFILVSFVSYTIFHMAPYAQQAYLKIIRKIIISLILIFDTLFIEDNTLLYVDKSHFFQATNI